MANTAWKRGGPSPNPLAWRSEQQWARAIRMVCSTEHEASGKRKLRVIAEKLVAQAIAGDLTAIAMVGDRLDGKAVQEANITHRRSIVDMSDQELLEIVAEAQKPNDDDTSLLIENDTPTLPDKQGSS